MSRIMEVVPMMSVVVAYKSVMLLLACAVIAAFGWRNIRCAGNRSSRAKTQPCVTAFAPYVTPSSCWGCVVPRRSLLPQGWRVADDTNASRIC